MRMVPASVYATVTSQAISSCGKLLCAADAYGRIAIFDLESDGDRPRSLIESEDGLPVCSAESAGGFLAVGTRGEIVGRDWKKPATPVWNIQIPDSKRSVDRPDVNSLRWNQADGTLCAGCGDNNVYSFDLSQGKLLRTYEGHTDFIHSVQIFNNELITASEDGHVKLWDMRSQKSYGQIVPSSEEKLARHDLGKWIGSAALSNDWIICGGGPKLSLWQRRSLRVAASPELPDHGIHVCYFHEDRIIAGGTAPYLYQLNYSGEVAVEIPVSATTVYSTALHLQPNFVLSIAGSSPFIDLCTNLNYKDRILHFDS